MGPSAVTGNAQPSATPPQGNPPAPGSPAGDAASAAKFDAQGGAVGGDQTPQRPEGLPEKFASWADLAKAYSELEAKQSKAAPAAPAQVQVPPATGISLKEAVKAASEGAQLTPEHYAALEKSGYDREVVDTLVNSAKATLEAETRELVGVAGGDEQFKALQSWMQANVKPDELAAFNEAVTNGSLAVAKLAMEGMVSRFKAAGSAGPDLINTGGSAPGTQGFASAAEQTAAINDPRYAKDPAYRAAVERRIAASNLGLVQVL